MLKKYTCFDKISRSQLVVFWLTFLIYIACVRQFPKFHFFLSYSDFFYLNFMCRGLLFCLIRLRSTYTHTHTHTHTLGNIRLNEESACRKSV